MIEITVLNSIGDGLYFGHPYCITINSKVIIGKKCNIHKGVTIGQENRGRRKGTPIIGNEVWIGVNSTIVGKINIGNDVLIALTVMLTVMYRVILLYSGIPVLSNIKIVLQRVI